MGGFFGAHAQEIPEEFYLDFQLFDNNASNAELTVSLDKFIYSPGDGASLFGYVNEYNKGVRIFIEIIDPIGNTRSQIIIATSNDGVFQSSK